MFLVFDPLISKKTPLNFFVFVFFSTLKNGMETLAPRVIFVGIFKKVELFCLISFLKIWEKDQGN